MRDAILGNGLRVSAIGLGCMGMSHGYSPADRRESLAALHEAIELGITHWDTADAYGADGANEILLGEVVQGRRDSVTLATKFGLVRDGSRKVDGRPERARPCLEASLRRLGVDHVDLFYLHRPDPTVPIEESVGAMAELVQAGLVRHLGLSEASAATLRRAARVHPIAALQTEYSLFARDIEGEIVDTARELGIGIVPYSPLGHGILTGAQDAGFTPGDGDLRARLDYFRAENLPHNVRQVRVVRAIADELEATPAQVALAWLLAQGDDIAPIPGSRRPEYLRDNAGAADVTLSADMLRRLDAIRPAGERYLDESLTSVDTPAATSCGESPIPNGGFPGGLPEGGSIA